MVADKPGAMALRLRDGTETTEETLRSVVAIMQEPTTQMLDAAFALADKLLGQKPSGMIYRAMIQVAIDELLHGEQVADTDGLAKLNDTLDRLNLPSRQEVQF